MSKNKAGKGKKDEGDPDADKKVFILGNKCVEFQRNKALEQEKSDKAKTTENNLRNKIIELDGLFNKEKENLFNITNEMNKQYKHMQDDLLKEINELKASVKKKIEIIDEQDNQIKQTITEYDQKLGKKEEEIVDLKRKIDDMSNEFARMLRETLDKMQERIELAQWDNETDPQTIKKLKDSSFPTHQ